MAKTYTYLLSTSFLAEHMLTQSSRIGAAVIGTGVGLYVVLNQDTNHGAEHHPLGEPHGEGDAPKRGTDSIVKKVDEKPKGEPKEKPKQSEEKADSDAGADKPAAETTDEKGDKEEKPAAETVSSHD